MPRHTLAFYAKPCTRTPRPSPPRNVNIIGRYQPVDALTGVKDFVGQVLPGPEQKAPGGDGMPKGKLLRRAKEYEVRIFQVQ